MPNSESEWEKVEKVEEIGETLEGETRKSQHEIRINGDQLYDVVKTKNMARIKTEGYGFNP